MNGAVMESKRWKFARAAIWGGILVAAAVFWLAVGAYVLSWLR